MQHLAGATQVEASLTNWNLLFCFCNGWQIEVGPAFLLKEMTNKVVQVRRCMTTMMASFVLSSKRLSSVFAYHCLVLSRAASE